MTLFGGIALFAGVSVFCVMQAVFWAVRRKRAARETALQERLRLSEYGAADDFDAGRGGDAWIERFDSARRLAKTLAQAGIMVPVGRFVLTCTLVLLFVLALVTIATGNPFSGIIVDMVVVMLIYMVVNGRRRRRLDAIDEQLPQSLELMTFSLRAGHTLEEAINFVSREVPEPLGSELRRCYEEYELGRPLQNALLNLALRLAPCQALRTFVEAVLVLKQTGGNLVEIMENLVETLRQQAAFEARHRALTSEGRTSGIILGSLPLLILAAVMLVQPGYVGSLVNTGTGQLVLMMGISLWGLGVFWLIRLLRPTT